ncbi:hypothetical protein [Corynebacterium caspium]|uniref:hypothetical protein n=1 Tax=Corynebacterium caspium TaxID=234828 RepID=UPI00036ED4FB|nr:hypothetical protein [Corynebacterium caspium]WKD59130.1 hypothetical protein CCASP_03630 [Corynebacterium caspium DSM 44850]
MINHAIRSNNFANQQPEYLRANEVSVWDPYLEIPDFQGVRHIRTLGDDPGVYHSGKNSARRNRAKLQAVPAIADKSEPDEDRASFLNYIVGGLFGLVLVLGYQFFGEDSSANSYEFRSLPGDSTVSSFDYISQTGSTNIR